MYTDVYIRTQLFTRTSFVYMHMFLSVLVCISTVAMTLYFHEECFICGGEGWG